MNKVLSFVKLDFLTVKPYLGFKYILILLAAMVFVGLSVGNSAVIIGMAMVYSTIYASYPFAVGEKNGMDGLYSVLAISRGRVVAGRYLYSLCMNLLSGAFAYAMSFIILTLSGKGFNWMEALATVLACLVIFTLIIAFQLPIFFKLGYAKAKMVSYLPLVGFPLAVFAIQWISENNPGIGSVFNQAADWLYKNPVAAGAVLVCLVALIYYISCLVSIRLYKRRDF